MTNFLHLDSQLYEDLNKNQNQNTYGERFSRLANELINKYVLCVNKTNFRISEIEFYLHTDDHLDIYTHRDIDQKTPCQWYFHKKGGSYKAGTYKGMDITFGFLNKLGDTYGGILIREIQNMDTLKYISGPCCTVDEILKTAGHNTIESLVNTLSKDNPNGQVFNSNNVLYLLKNDMLIEKTIYSGPRVGLSFGYPDFLVRDYRFLTNLYDTKKYKAPIVLKMRKEGRSATQIKTAANVSELTTQKYLKLYEDGKKLSNLKNIKPSNTNILLASGYVNK